MNCAFIDAIDVTSESETRLPPLGLASISAVLRERAGVEDILIGRPGDLGALRSFSPDIIGISSVSQNYTFACRLAARLKEEFGVPLVVGGPHISGLPVSLDPHFDAGVIGEGELTMLEIVRALQAGRLDREALGSIAGIVYRDGESLRITPSRPLIDDLDSLPHPAFDLLDIGPTMHVVTSRGCPCRCAFCSSSSIWQRLRCYSAEYVIADIKQLVERYGVRRINIMDDLFSADRKRLGRIADALEREGVNRKVFFSCHARAEFVNEEVCRDLKRMGVQSITFGFESGSQRILSYLKGGGASVEKNLAAARICQRAGLRVGGSFIIGSPGEGAEDIRKTYDFIRRSGITGGGVYLLVPYPGTRIWDYAKERGLVDDRMDWGRLNVESFDARREMLLTDEIEAEELQRLYIQIRGELEKRLDETAGYLYARDYDAASLLSLRKIARAVRNPGKAVSFLRNLIRYRVLKKDLKPQ